MLLKSIELKNFRQFRNEYIDFADGNDGKNVTIIIGENGTGKTTFAQAFFWCMYGMTEFSDKNLLNKLVGKEMRPGKAEYVKVILKLKHGEIEYKLTREQAYHKDTANRIKADNSIFDIELKDQNGNSSFVKKSACESEVESILPQELAKYFFFDGERIEKMSKDISSNKKATDFAEAVKGLLGLNAMSSAIQHFNPRSRNSVLGSYEAGYNSQSNVKIQEYTNIIENCQAKISDLEAKKENYENEIEAARQRKIEKSEEIKQYKEGEKLQNDKEDTLKRIAQIERLKATTNKVICSDFNKNFLSFFSTALIKDALELLSEKDFAGKDIPYMHAKTIEYLLEQKICICGTHLDEGTVPYNKVKELIEFLPPQSISTMISDFKKEASRRAKGSNSIFESMKEQMEIASKYDEDLENLTDELAEIEKKLSGEDVKEKVRSINSIIQTCDQIIKSNNAKRDSCIAEIATVESERNRAESERQKLSLLDEKNRRVEIYKAYASKIYEDLKFTYATSEAQIRNKLQTTINDIFKQIYEGGLYLTIDEKYHITVYANDYEGDVETSTAQSISVIFAFISGIIKMARENRVSDDEDAKLLSSEPYPLVMDAPLSAFDKRRIETVCKALPEVAEQVVIFIKDTDGELAESHMGDRIGRRHSFDKKNEFETVLV